MNVQRTWAGSSAAFAAAVAFFGVLPEAALGQSFVNTGLETFSTRVVSMRDMPFRTVVRQQYDFSCGSAALATLLRHHYGRDIGEADVFKAMYATGDQAAIRRVGFSLLDMKLYLQSIGLSADGFRETMTDLANSKSPAIAVVKVGDYRHFVVVKGVADGKILVGDPAQGLKIYSAAEFAKVWNGVAFVVHDPAGLGTFNRPEEWGTLHHGRPVTLDDKTLAGLTRELPPIYQITPFRVAGQ